jgi:transposase, IS5 family
MAPHKENRAQLSLLPTLEELLSRKNPLYQLSKVVDWGRFEKAFLPLYSEKTGAPAKPIRRMVGLLVLKHVRNLSDERVVEEWVENAYFQYFCGEVLLAHGAPCEASELVHFRHRIGEAGMELILSESIRIQSGDLGQDGGEVTVDTTVQHKDITFPTDDKLYRKIASKCVGIAQKEGVKLRQTYTKTLKNLRYQQRPGRTKAKMAAVKKANRRVKTIAGYLVRELIRKLPDGVSEKHLAEIDLFLRVLEQKRSDSNKVYSLHEPHVKCIAKGKAHPKYEFGSKVSLALGKHSGIVVGALNFSDNPYDGHTLPDVLEQIEKLTGGRPQKAICDLGYRGKKQVGTTAIVLPSDIQKANQKDKPAIRRDLKRRAAIEAHISHEKRAFRLGRNFYKGIFGDQINILLAAAAANFARWMRLKANSLWAFLRTMWHTGNTLAQKITALSIFFPFISYQPFSGKLKWVFKG